VACADVLVFSHWITESKSRSDWNVGANLMGFSVLLSYAARRTGFSVPIAILLHAALNAGPAMGMALVMAPPADLHAVENKAQMVRWAVVLIGAVTLAREGAHPLAASFEEKKVG
jgi:membrane protease YdiL (CAAX protease family)